MRAGQAVKCEGTDHRRSIASAANSISTLEYESRDAVTDELLMRQAITSVLLIDKERCNECGARGNSNRREMVSKPYLLDAAAAKAYREGIESPARRRPRAQHPRPIRTRRARRAFAAPIAGGEQTYRGDGEIHRSNVRHGFPARRPHRRSLTRPVFYGDTLTIARENRFDDDGSQLQLEMDRESTRRASADWHRRDQDERRMSAGPIRQLQRCVARRAARGAHNSDLAKAIPYLGTVAIFALIFWRIPMAQSRAGAGAGADTRIHRRVSCRSRVLLGDRFGLPHLGGAPLQRADALSRHPADSREHVPAGAHQHQPRARRRRVLSPSQGGNQLPERAQLDAVHRDDGNLPALPVLDARGDLLHASRAAQIEIVKILRVVYIVAWILALRNHRFFSRLRAATRAFATGSRPAEQARCSRRSCKARPLDYLVVLAIKAPTLSRVGRRAVFRADAVRNRDPVREADAVSSAGVPGRRAADRSGASRHQPGGVAAVFLGQRDAE